MSDLQPKGIPVEIGGKERRLLFTLAAVDEIQEKYGKPVGEVLEMMQDDTKVAQVAFDLFLILLNDEIERNRFFHGAEEEPVTEKQLKWWMDMSGMPEYVAALLVAYGLSVPDAEEDDPNPESLSS